MRDANGSEPALIDLIGLRQAVLVKSAAAALLEHPASAARNNSSRG